MKLNLTKKQEQKIRMLVLGTKVNCGHFSIYNNKRATDWIGYISDFSFDKDKKKFIITIDKKNGKEFISFKKFLYMIGGSDRYKVNSRNLKNLSSAYCKAADNDNVQEFINFLESIGETTFKIEPCEILDDEVAWLDKHVIRIDAIFPPKYLKDFQKHFNSDAYRLNDRSWAYGFTLYFNSMENIPQSLLEKRNSDGNPLDYEGKKMCNTSYIWHLVTDYPDKFNFGKRELKK